MFDKMISWGELITIVLFVLGSGLLFYLILAVANLLKVLKNVNQLIEDNKENIDKTLKKLPEITDNTAKATGLIKDNLEGIDKVVGDVGKISNTVKNAVDVVQKDIILKAKSILDIIDAIKTLFEKRKEKSVKRKKNQEGTVYKYKYKHGMDKPEQVEIQTQNENFEEPVPDGYIKENLATKEAAENDIESEAYTIEEDFIIDGNDEISDSADDEEDVIVEED